jgi:glycosyltransferase involved in cell wall biosynthesis
LNTKAPEHGLITLSVVIPAFNEENGINDIIDRVLAITSQLKEAGIGKLELIIVDDGSSDHTAQRVSGYQNVNLIRHSHNMGYGAALKTGFHAAQGNYIGFLDADGTYPPECFPLLCKELTKGADLVVGSRRSGSETEMPLVRRLGNFVWSNLISLLGGERVLDPASGMRVFRRQILEKLYPLPDGLNLTPVMSTRAIHENINVVEVPIPYRERVGRSKLSVVRDGTRFLNSIIWTVLTYNPVRILGFIGLGLVAFSVVVALCLLAIRLSGVTVIGPFGVAALYAALVAGVAGVSIFSLGATFNYMVALFTKRPVRQGLFKRPLFKQPFEKHFGWLGATSFVFGLTLTVISLLLGLSGWEIARLWLYLLGSALFILVGIQLIIYWILIRVLAELSEREILVYNETMR